MNNPLDPTLRELNACGCCAGTAAETPVAIDNRPGLDAIAFRAGNQPQFKATLLAALSAAARPALAQLKTREDDDFTIALLDGWAAVGDVLTFYSERIANESYLRTATERRSVLELARAIGYELKPGVAAATWLAFTVEDAPGSPGYASIPKGTKVQSLPGPDEKPQLYETLADLPARKEWNTLQPVRTQVPQLYWGQTKVRLQGVTTQLKPGDALLLIGDERKHDPTNENWDFRRVQTVQPFASADPPYTLVTLNQGLGKAIPPMDPAQVNARVYALRQSLNLFGYNAPDPRALQFTVAGLLGEYFQGTNFEHRAFTRVDAKVDFNWNGISPGAGLGTTNYSVRWTGVVKTGAAGTYTFLTNTDDGVRLWVNGQKLVDKWIDQGATPWSGSIWLDADRYYDLRVEYYQGPGAAVAQLSWSGPGLSQQIIPPEHLFRTELPSEWPGLTLADIAGTPAGAPVTTLHLDGTHPEVIAGSWLVVATPEYSEVYRVATVAEDAKRGFTLNAKTTRVGVSGENLREQFNDQVRSAMVFAQSEELLRAAEPVVEPVGGDAITLDRLIPDLPVGRPLLVRGTAARARILPAGAPLVLTLADHSTVPLTAGQLLTVLQSPTPVPSPAGASLWNLQTVAGQSGWVSALPNQIRYNSAPADATVVMEVATLRQVETAGGVTRLRLVQPLQRLYDPFTVSVLVNVAYGTHGESVAEVLGSGDASQPNQQFTLRQKPLTYVPDTSPAGAASTLEVWVNDVKWREVPTLYNRAPGERVFISRLADDGTVKVEFGDGESGSRLPTGQENLRAVYRKGIGSAGRVKPDQLSLLMTRPLGVKSVTNPMAPSEPADPQSLGDARRNAPRTVLTLDRVVSLLDYEDFTRDFPGIAKAMATWTWSEHTRGVLLSVLGADGRVLPEDGDTVQRLIAALLAAGNPLVPVLVKSAPPVRFTLRAQITPEADRDPVLVVAAVREVLKAQFAFDAREFGQGVALSEVMALMQTVPGVAAVELTRLKRPGTPALPQPAPYLPATKPANGIAASDAVAAELLILDETSLADVEAAVP